MMIPPADDGKRRLRQAKLAARKNLTAAGRAAADASIRARVAALPEFHHAAVIAAYVSDGTEPDLMPLLRHARQDGKTICLPRFRPDTETYEMAEADADFTLIPGKWGLPEPPESVRIIPDSSLQHALWLVPGVAFDDNCGRLGRGKGFYDRLLAGNQGCHAGIFYDCQKTAAVPMEPHDRNLTLVVTESRLYRRKKTKKMKPKGE